MLIQLKPSTDQPEPVIPPIVPAEGQPAPQQVQPQILHNTPTIQPKDYGMTNNYADAISQAIASMSSSLENGGEAKLGILADTIRRLIQEHNISTDAIALSAWPVSNANSERDLAGVMIIAASAVSTAIYFVALGSTYTGRMMQELNQQAGPFTLVTNVAVVPADDSLTGIHEFLMAEGVKCVPSIATTKINVTSRLIDDTLPSNNVEQPSIATRIASESLIEALAALDVANTATTGIGGANAAAFIKRLNARQARVTFDASLSRDRTYIAGDVQAHGNATVTLSSFMAVAAGFGANRGAAQMSHGQVQVIADVVRVSPIDNGMPNQHLDYFRSIGIAPPPAMMVRSPSHQAVMVLNGFSSPRTQTIESLMVLIAAALSVSMASDVWRSLYRPDPAAIRANNHIGVLNPIDRVESAPDQSGNEVWPVIQPVGLDAAAMDTFVSKHLIAPMAAIRFPGKQHTNVNLETLQRAAWEAADRGLVDRALAAVFPGWSYTGPLFAATTAGSHVPEGFFLGPNGREDLAALTYTRLAGLVNDVDMMGQIGAIPWTMAQSPGALLAALRRVYEANVNSPVFFDTTASVMTLAPAFTDALITAVSQRGIEIASSLRPDTATAFTYGAPVVGSQQHYLASMMAGAGQVPGAYGQGGYVYQQPNATHWFN